MRITMFPARVRRDDNPFVPILVNALEELGVEVQDFGLLGLGAGGAALHLHWLEGIFWGRMSSRVSVLPKLRARRLLALAQRMNASGRPVVWTVHNLEPHDFASDTQRQLFLRFHNAMLPLVTDVICMSPEVRALIVARFPEIKNARLHIVPHPHYIDYFRGAAQSLPPEAEEFVTGAQGRAGAPLLGMFGMLRPYKGIPALVTRLRESGQDFRIVVAGSGPSEEIAAIRASMGDDPRFLLVARRISEGELVALTRACRLVLFNFNKILNSGSVLAALSLGAQVLVPRLGALRDLRDEVGGAPWVTLFDGDDATTVLYSLLAAPAPEGGVPNLSYCAPARVAQAHIQIYAGETEIH